MVKAGGLPFVSPSRSGQPTPPHRRWWDHLSDSEVWTDWFCPPTPSPTSTVWLCGRHLHNAEFHSQKLKLESSRSDLRLQQGHCLRLLEVDLCDKMQLFAVLNPKISIFFRGTLNKIHRMEIYEIPDPLQFNSHRDAFWEPSKIPLTNFRSLRIPFNSIQSKELRS